ncbi:MAG: radical SAM protein, partial [Elusimicrobiales bacterium]|nr:radical SAM protein [Elusimicrobiales bacterium]
MKIALINPPFPPPPLWILLATRSYNYPLGLAYLAAYVRRAGHEVKLFDPEPLRMTPERMWKEVAEFGPDLVGITSVTPNFTIAKELALEAKKRFDCLVVMGGPHPNALPRSTLLGVPGLDAVILGEGEIPLAALAAEFDSAGKVDFNKIPGAAFLEAWKYKETPRPELIADLDTLPSPARDLADMRLYYPNRWFFGGKKSTTLLSSRGCPGQCTFCANICMGRKFRPNSPGYVVEEMAGLVKKYGLRHFKIYDDCFTANAGRAAAICDLLIERRLNITWEIMGRVNTLLDEALMVKMKRAGCRHIILGIETGSQRILNLMKKGTTLAMAEECCAKLRKHGIAYSNSFIIGNDGDTEETIMETIAFAKKLKSGVAAFVVMMPFPGTPLFDKYFKDYDKPDTDWTNWCSMVEDRPYEPRQTQLSMKDLMRLKTLAD